MTGDPAELLDEMADLRKRVRDDRHGYWLPLLLFGILSFGSIPLSGASDNPTFLISDGGPGWWINPLVHLGLKAEHEVQHPLALSLYWIGVLVLGLLATVWWYHWRARRVGVETSTSAYVQAAVFGSCAALLGIPLSTSLFYEYSPIYPGLLLTVVVMAVLLALASLAFRARRARPLLVPVGLVLVSMALSLLQLPDIGVDLGMGGMAQFTVIAFGLLTLAWIERSRLCTAIAVVFAGSVLVANNSPMNIDALGNAQDVLLPATVLVLGGLVALVTRRRPNAGQA